MRPTGDRGGIVLGWLTRVVAVMAVLGLFGFDAISMASTRVTAEDHAQLAARAAAESFEQTQGLQSAYDAALREVTASGDTIDAPSFRAAADGTVTLTLHRVAPTLVVSRIPPVRDWARQSATVTTLPAP